MINQYLLIALLGMAESATASTTIPVTPHEQYSSSIGVLGCKINTNRVAYWPSSPDCGANLCVKVSYQGRSLYLLHIDHSGGAYDVSYDAYNYLVTGQSAVDDPITGGAVSMSYDAADMSKCSDLIMTDHKKLPLSAANSMNYVSDCLQQQDSWVAKNYALWNIANPICQYGYNEQCTLNLTASNQPSCPHTLGSPISLKGQSVYNIQYGTGKKVLAGAAPGSSSSTSSAASFSRTHARWLVTVLALTAAFFRF